MSELEPRRLLSVAAAAGPTASIVGTILEITGTPGDDTISVKSGGRSVIVTADDSFNETFALARLTGVVIDGGDGNDTLRVGLQVNLQATLKGNNGNDSLTGGGGGGSGGTDGGNLLVGGVGNDTLLGGAGDNELFPGEYDTHSATPGDDLLEGGSGRVSVADFAYRTDNLVLSNDGLPDSGDAALGEKVTIMPDVQEIFSGSGNDTLKSTGSDFLSGGAGNDLLLGSTQGRDILVDGNGNNTLVANASEDELYGRGGSDLFLLNNSNPSTDIIQADKNDKIVTGISFAQFSGIGQATGVFQPIDPPPPASVPADTQPSTSQAAPADATAVTSEVVNSVLTITGTAGNDSIEVSLNGSTLHIAANGNELPPVAVSGLTGLVVAGLAGNDTLVVDPSVTLLTTLQGAGGNDSLAGGSGANALIGGAGSDTLVGGSDENVLIPEAYKTYSAVPTGNDSLVGGSGMNIADFSYRTDGLHLSNDGKPDSGDLALGESTTISTNISEIFGGAANDTIIGKSAGEFLSGGYGADSITSGGASDLILGGKGKDTVHLTAGPLSLFLAGDGAADGYYGVINGSDILELDPGLDSILPM